MIDFCYNLNGNQLLDWLMLLLSWFGNGIYVPVILTGLMGLVFLYNKKIKMALAVVFAPILGNGIKMIIKEMVGRPRPGAFGCRDLVNLNDYSFPSGHTIYYTIFFGLLAWYGYKYLRGEWFGKLLYIFSGLMVLSVGFSRVYLGAHWITDVLAGYVIGGIILTATIYLLRQYPDPAK